MVKTEDADAYAAYPEVNKEIGDFGPEAGYGEGEYLATGDNGYEDGAPPQIKQEPYPDDEDMGPAGERGEKGERGDREEYKQEDDGEKQQEMEVGRNGGGGGGEDDQ